jgi:hypothetical protein
MHDGSHGFSWWWESGRVYHVVDAESAVESLSRMNAIGFQGGNDDELGVDL